MKTLNLEVNCFDKDEQYIRNKIRDFMIELYQDKNHENLCQITSNGSNNQYFCNSKTSN